MKRRAVRILLFASLLLVAGSCDMVRTILSKPTSEDIERMRMELMKAERRRMDSVSALEIAAAEAAAADTSASDSIVVVPTAEDSIMGPIPFVSDTVSSESESESESAFVSASASNFVGPMPKQEVSEESGMKRFNVVAASLSKEENIKKLLKRLEKEGLHPYSIPLKNDVTLVCACASDSQEEAENKRGELRRKGLIGGESWIYDANSKRHK